MAKRDSINLYQCNGMPDLLPSNYKGFVNEENEEITDNAEWINFLIAIEKAQSPSDIEDIFEIDHFLYEMAIE